VSDEIRVWAFCTPGETCDDCGEILTGVADATLLEAWRRINDSAHEGRLAE
jgi:hypothetical protein